MMSQPIRTAHVLDEKWRSKDVRLQEKADFSSMLLSDRVLAGLRKSGFKIPSPIQIHSIPVGRFGRDLVVQAKSGTGKTLVFTIIALEALLDIKFPQVLILAPTREIATQICDVIKSVGCEIKGLKCNCFIGGIPISKDVDKCVGCQIVVGTPGRIRQLIDNGNLPIHSVRMLILDEADVLLEPSFKPDIDFIFMTLPKEKQVIATSATYPKELKHFICLYFRDAFLACLNKNELALLGITHYIHQVEASKMPHLAYKLKIAALEKILTAIQFTQCLVFCNLITRVEPLCYDIRIWGFSTAFISSAKEQGDRLKAIDCLKRFRCKILVSSDVTARGIDAENVDMIINFDKPRSLETYMHRCGRAGRYGSKGVVISFLTTDEIETFESLKKEGNFQAYSLPDPVPPNLISIRPKALEMSDDESSENDDSKAKSANNSPCTNEIIQNGENFNERNRSSPLSQKKVHDSAENSSQEEGRFKSAEYNDNVLEENNLLDNDEECDLVSNHALNNANSNGSEINKKSVIDSQVLKNNTVISIKSKKICDVPEEFNCVKDTEELISVDILDESHANSTSANNGANINQSYVAAATKESDSFNGVHFCRDENDANICNVMQVYNESIPKDLDRVKLENRVENNSNTSNDIKQNLQTNNDCFFENVGHINNNDIKQDAVATFVTNSNFTDNNLSFDVNTTENKSEAAVSVATLQAVQPQVSDVKLLNSNSSVLNKIQLPILQFLFDCDKKCDERSSKNIPKKSSTVETVRSKQVKEVRENLSNFYQKIFKAYQSTIIDEETYNGMRSMSQNKVKNALSTHTEDGKSYKKVVLHYNKDIDKSSESESDESTSSTLSEFSAFKVLEDHMFQGKLKQTSKTKNHEIDSKDVSTASSSSSDSSSDSTDVEHYRELLRNKVKGQNFSSKALVETGNQNSNEQSYNSKKQRDVKENCSSEKLQPCIQLSFALDHADGGRQHGARRKTFFQNGQTRADNLRKPAEYSSESEDSYNQKFTEVSLPKTCVPHVKKTKVKSISNTVKDHENASHLKYTNNYSQPYYHHYQNSQHFPTYVPQNPVTSQNEHCSNHHCHATSSSFCSNDVCGDWYGIYLKQWQHIQMSSRNVYQMNFYH